MLAAANLETELTIVMENGRDAMEEDERAIMGLVVIVGFVLLWIFLEEFGYFGLLTINK
ncbi:hypothetical protein ACPV47_09440 [Vibrio jasicida]|nr:hypothetical protein [Vibrio hyugaensis]